MITIKQYGGRIFKPNPQTKRLQDYIIDVIGKFHTELPITSISYHTETVTYTFTNLFMSRYVCLCNN